MKANEIRARAASLGLRVCTWSPGDGRTRYRFFEAATTTDDQSWFGPADPIGSCVGAGEAAIFLRGVKVGRRLEWMAEHGRVPADFPVRPLARGEPAADRVTCGTCDRSWDDAVVTGMTPAPSARCPFEAFHAPE